MKFNVYRIPSSIVRISYVNEASTSELTYFTMQFKSIKHIFGANAPICITGKRTNERTVVQRDIMIVSLDKHCDARDIYIVKHKHMVRHSMSRSIHKNGKLFTLNHLSCTLYFMLHILTRQQNMELTIHQFITF